MKKLYLPSHTKKNLDITALINTSISNTKLEYVKKIAIEIGVEIFTKELQSTRYHFGTYGSNTKASVEL